MYESHWGLSQTPFASNLDPAAFFESRVHEEALARLNYLVEERRRLGLLLGAHGSGKSLLLEVLYDQLRQAARPVARLRLLGVSAEEFPWLLARQFGIDPRVESTPTSLWRSIADRLIENRHQQWGTVVLLDDVDEADETVRSSILRMLQLDTSPQAQLTVILTAQLGGAQRIGPRLLEVAELRIELANWDLDDTRGYLDHALQRAGRARQAFDAEAVAQLQQLSAGVPRRVCQLADLALMAGAGQRQQQVDAPTVQAVYQELGIDYSSVAQLSTGLVS